MTFDYSIDYHFSSRLEFNLAHRYRCLMNKNYQEPDNLDYAFIFNIIILVYNVIEFILSILSAFLMAVHFQVNNAFKNTNNDGNLFQFYQLIINKFIV